MRRPFWPGFDPRPARVPSPERSEREEEKTCIARSSTVAREDISTGICSCTRCSAGFLSKGRPFFLPFPGSPSPPLTYAIFAGVAFLQGMCRFRDFPPNASLGGFLFFTFPFQGTPPPLRGMQKPLRREPPDKGRFFPGQGICCKGCFCFSSPLVPSTLLGATPPPRLRPGVANNKFGA